MLFAQLGRYIDIYSLVSSKNGKVTLLNNCLLFYNNKMALAFSCSTGTKLHVHGIKKERLMIPTWLSGDGIRRIKPQL